MSVFRVLSRPAVVDTSVKSPHNILFLYSCSTDLGFLNRSWWDEDLREGVHGSLHWVALDPGHRAEDFLCKLGLVSQSVQDRALLLGTDMTHDTQEKGRTVPSTGDQTVHVRSLRSRKWQRFEV